MEHVDQSINNSGGDVDECKSTSSLDKKAFIQPSRRIVIEPMLMMFYLSSTTLMQVSQLYVYSKMQEIVAHKNGLNMSVFSVDNSNNHSTDLCLEEVNKSSIQYILTQAAQAENAHFSMISKVVSTVPSLFMMVILGSYSDKGGRRIAIVPFVIGEFLSSCLFFVVLYFNLSVWILQVNYGLSGLTGGWALMLVGCYSYIADTTSKEDRLFRFTLLNILDEMMSVIGPIGIGYWIKEQGYIWPVVFAMVIRFINAIYATFFIPETVKKDGKTKLFTLTHMRQSAQVFLKNDENNRRWKLWTLLFVFIIFCIGAGVMTPLSLFELNTPLCWDAVTLGYFKTTYTAVAAFGGLCSTKGLKLLVSDVMIAVIASLAQTAQYVYRVFVKNTWMMFLSASFGVFTITLFPTTRALMSQQVTEHEQGSAFGVIAVVESLAMLAGAEFFSLVYTKTLFISTSFVFAVAAGIYCLALGIFSFYECRIRQERRQYQRLEQTE